MLFLPGPNILFDFIGPVLSLEIVNVVLHIEIELPHINIVLGLRIGWKTVEHTQFAVKNGRTIHWLSFVLIIDVISGDEALESIQYVDGLSAQRPQEDSTIRSGTDDKVFKPELRRL